MKFFPCWDQETYSKVEQVEQTIRNHISRVAPKRSMSHLAENAKGSQFVFCTTSH